MWPAAARAVRTSTRSRAVRRRRALPRGQKKPSRLTGQQKGTILPGQYLDYSKTNLFTMIEFFAFLDRFAEQLEPGEDVVYELAAAPLQGKRLVADRWRFGMEPSDPCPSPAYRCSRRRREWKRLGGVEG